MSSNRDCVECFYAASPNTGSPCETCINYCGIEDNWRPRFQEQQTVEVEHAESATDQLARHEEVVYHNPNKTIEILIGGRRFCFNDRHNGGIEIRITSSDSSSAEQEGESGKEILLLV